MYELSKSCRIDIVVIFPDISMYSKLHVIEQTYLFSLLSFCCRPVVATIVFLFSTL